MPEVVTDQLFELSPGRLTAGEAAGARLLVVAGGRAGVGATTVAIHVARELAQDAQRVVLIDADLARPSIAGHCNLTGSMTIADVLTGRKTIHEALQRGPEGTQVLAGDAAIQAKNPLDERSISRLLKQLRTLAPHAEWLILDVGHQVNELTTRLWSTADKLLLVTAQDAVAVMDTYAVVKTVHSRKALKTRPALVVNNIADGEVAADVHRRIDQSCRRFLGLSISFAAALSSDPAASAFQPNRAGPLAAGVAHLCKHLQHAPHSATSPPLAA
jgi:flagellar biosynthesis protein FlhG